MSYAGGVIFYLDSTGSHGLVCAPIDQGLFQWGCRGTNIIGTLYGNGTGQANTNLILSGCSVRPIAASVCDNLILNGYSDWYLPSLGELELMYSRLHIQGLGGFGNNSYWSSLQPSPNNAWRMIFASGSVNSSSKSDANQVRAVRSF
jgi:hypothetical protein